MNQMTDIMPELKITRTRTDSQMEKLASEILNHWNSKNIIVHRKYSKRTPLILRRLTEDYSHKDILQAINNYERVIKDESYPLRYKWNLETFLQKSNALPDFMDDGSKWINYLGSLHKSAPIKKLISIVELEENPFLSENDNSQLIKENYSKMIKAFNTIPYEEYLQTDHWLHFKAEALKASAYRCKMCNTPDDTLHVHHNNYSNRGRETFNDVIVLCGECHAKFHNKESENRCRQSVRPVEETCKEQNHVMNLL